MKAGWITIIGVIVCTLLFIAWMYMLNHSMYQITSTINIVG